MARFKVIYSYGKSPMSGTVMGQTHTYNNVVYHWKDNEELEFPDEKQAMDFYNKIIDSWEKEEIYYKDRDSKKIHYNSVVVKAFKNGMWVPIKSANYKDWYDANKERKQKEYMEKNKQQPAGIVDNVMENKKNMKKQIKLKENELRKIVECKVRESLNEFYSMENGMFRKASDTDNIESTTQPQGQPTNQQQANMEEDTKAQRKKDPLNQAFQDMEKAQKFRDTMDKIYDKNKKPLKESQFRRIVENKVRGMLKEMFEGTSQPGSISHGTMRPIDLIPTFMNILKKEAPQRAQEILQNYPDLDEALTALEGGVEDEAYFDSEEAVEVLNNEIWDAMQEIAPEGHYFGSHPGDGSDYGYWPSDDEEPALTIDNKELYENKKPIKESQFRKIVENKVRCVMNEMFEENGLEQYNNYLEYLFDNGHISDKFMGFLKQCDFSASLGETLSAAASSNYLI